MSRLRSQCSQRISFTNSLRMVIKSWLGRGGGGSLLWKKEVTGSRDEGGPSSNSKQLGPFITPKLCCCLPKKITVSAKCPEWGQWGSMIRPSLQDRACQGTRLWATGFLSPSKKGSGPERPNYRAWGWAPGSMETGTLIPRLRQSINPTLFPTPPVPVKETSASLSCPSSWTLSLSDLEPPRARFMFRKYWPQRCRPASFLSLFSLARRFWNHTWRRGGGRR